MQSPRSPPNHLTDGGADHGPYDHVARVVHSGVDAGVSDGAGEHAQGRGGRGENLLEQEVLEGRQGIKL